jgi:hypothetical protein
MAELAVYRGYKLIVDKYDILVIAPNGDLACFTSMASVRGWVRRHKREHRVKVARTLTLVTLVGMLAASALIGGGTAGAVKAPSSIPVAVQMIDRENHTQGNPAEDVWYPLGGSLAVPAGTWRLSYRVTVYSSRQKSDAGTIESFTTLSTSSSAATDPRFTTVDRAGGNLYRMMVTHDAENVITAGKPTRFYVLVKESSSDSFPWDSLEVQAHTGSTLMPTVIRAERLG